SSGLDPNQVIEIRGLIREIGKDKTVLLSTHIMQEVEAMCNRVVIINRGKIVADDQIEALNKTLSPGVSISLEFQQDIKESLLKNIHGVLQVRQKGKRYLLRC